MCGNQWTYVVKSEKESKESNETTEKKGVNKWNCTLFVATVLPRVTTNRLGWFVRLKERHCERNRLKLPISYTYRYSIGVPALSAGFSEAKVPLMNDHHVGRTLQAPA